MGINIFLVANYSMPVAFPTKQKMICWKSSQRHLAFGCIYWIYNSIQLCLKHLQCGVGGPSYTCWEHAWMAKLQMCFLCILQFPYLYWQAALLLKCTISAVLSVWLRKLELSFKVVIMIIDRIENRTQTFFLLLHWAQTLSKNNKLSFRVAA